MARLTPQQAAEKWANNTAGATQAMEMGVDSVTTSPGQQAARNKDLWVQRTTAARDKWAANTAAVPLEDWKNAMKSRGIPRVSQGVHDAQNKFADFMSAFLPHVNSVAERVRQMPKGTLQNSIDRARAQIEGNAAFRRNR